MQYLEPVAPAVYLEGIKNASELIKASKDCVIVAHNDADGICSSLILEKAMARAGVGPVNSYYVEKTFPGIIRYVYAHHPGSAVFFSDIGSERMHDISKAVQDYGNRSVVIDHHRTHGVQPAIDRLINLNCEDFGIPAESNLSASTIAYLVARAIDPGNSDLSYLAVIGSMDDFGTVSGLDKIAFADGFNIHNGNTRLIFFEGNYYEVGWSTPNAPQRTSERAGVIGENISCCSAMKFFADDNLKDNGVLKRLKAGLEKRCFDSVTDSMIYGCWQQHDLKTDTIDKQLTRGGSGITLGEDFVYIHLPSITDTSKYSTKYAGLVADWIAANSCEANTALSDVIVVMVGQSCRTDLPMMGHILPPDKLKISYRLTKRGAGVDLAQMVSTTKHKLGDVNHSAGSHTHKAAIAIDNSQIENLIRISQETLHNIRYS
ncbi:MAG: hypothetical protein KJ601_00780 [Nanoarchaeota archaeon]|nr:hypothetical protein [Nanoarchaeota archaeon]MBU1704935.1 hypothetical protein [Nanoarchaeota archaeon]